MSLCSQEYFGAPAIKNCLKYRWDQLAIAQFQWCNSDNQWPAGLIRDECHPSKPELSTLGLWLPKGPGVTLAQLSPGSGRYPAREASESSRL